MLLFYCHKADSAEIDYSGATGERHETPPDVAQETDVHVQLLDTK